ncbi:MAG TPA: hypothetical protein VJ385_20985 [Fibrobacteria bacterium]|nr:hypothetical protein [Fibrobacteria bacterium]
MHGLPKHRLTGTAAALALCAFSAALADTWTTSNGGKITTQATSTKVGIGLTGNANVRGWLDVEGNAAIGAGYSGNSTVTPPANGLLVEGNVGLGTSAPVSGSKLDVNGLLNVRNRLTLTGTSSTAPTLNALHTSASGNIAEFRSGASPGTIQASISSSGHMWVQGSLATSGVHVYDVLTCEGSGGVNGSWYASDLHANDRITVGTGGMAAPDYVFDEKKYKPMSLREVERFVKKHKHLPEIPPAKDLETKGINVAEMNLLLLKKVEELTLHAIEQDKKIRALSAKFR